MAQSDHKAWLDPQAQRERMEPMARPGLRDLSGHRAWLDPRALTAGSDHKVRLDP